MRTGDRPGQQSLDHQRPTRSDRHPGTPPVDRQLEEALTPGPDPVHLATVFGIDEKTAIRYATTVRQLLQTLLECDPSD